MDEQWKKRGASIQRSIDDLRQNDTEGRYGNLADFLDEEVRWTEEVRSKIDSGLLTIEEVRELRLELERRKTILHGIKARILGQGGAA